MYLVLGILSRLFKPLQDISALLYELIFTSLQGMKASGEVEHERVGEVYTTLVGLLKAKSEHFATTIAKQVCQK